MARKVSLAVGGALRGKTIGVLGLTFKPDTDDMREAPSIRRSRSSPVFSIWRDGARAYDPAGMEQVRSELPGIEFCADAYACAKDADALVIVTEWMQVRALDLGRLKETMAQPVVLNLRNIYRPEDMLAAGFV